MNKIKYLFGFLVLIMTGLFLLIACNKNNEQCETWEYQDECVPLSSYAGCNEYTRRVSYICGAELKDAVEGHTSIIREDANTRLVRHYIKRTK